MKESLLKKHLRFVFKCMVNCIYREFEIYDGETINMASVNTFLETQIPQEEEFVTMYTNAFESCSKLGNNINGYRYTCALYFNYFTYR